MTDHETLVAEIRAELGASRRDLARIERTLTDACARALALETERLQLERGVRSLAAALDGRDVVRKTQELSALAKRLEANDDALIQLRGLLNELRSEHSRGAAAARGRRARARRAVGL